MKDRTMLIFDEKELQERMRHSRKITREEVMELIRKGQEKRIGDKKK